MWLCTKLGFYSIVKKSDGLHVRSRVLSDLVNLRSAANLVDVPLQNWSGADYRHRLVLAHEGQQAAVWMALMNSVTYSNFKSEIGQSQEQSHKLRDYHDIHSLGVLWQREDLERRVKTLVTVSVEDVKNSAALSLDEELLEAALIYCDNLQLKNKARVLRARLKQLQKSL
jgi:hypothetical protein